MISYVCELNLMTIHAYSVYITVAIHIVHYLRVDSQTSNFEMVL